MSLFWTCMTETWTPIVGDPDTLGWGSTLLYLLAALAVNKQLDLQTFVVAAGRCVSTAQGWYGIRRAIQLVFALSVAGLLGGWIVWILIGLRHSLRQMWLELLGVVAVVAFVLLRALRFLHVYQTHMFGNNSWASRIFELTGPLLLIAAAILVLRVHRTTLNQKA